MNYDLRPITPEVISICAENDYCTNCPLRLGCKIRYDFYTDDTSYEIKLQVSEIYAVQKFHLPADAANAATWVLRNKRNCELMTYPYFSYT